MADSSRSFGHSAGHRRAAETRADLHRLDHPDPRGRGRRRDRGPAHHERGPDHHHRLQGRRGPRGGQDRHQVQGRQHRPGEEGRALRRPLEGGGDGEDGEERGGPDGRGREVLGRRGARHAERGVRPRHAPLGQLHRLRDRQVQEGAARVHRARGGADHHRRSAGPAVRAEGREPRLAGDRLADLLPPPPGRPGHRVRSVGRRQGGRPQDLRQRAV